MRRSWTRGRARPTCPAEVGEEEGGIGLEGIAPAAGVVHGGIGVHRAPGTPGVVGASHHSMASMKLQPALEGPGRGSGTEPLLAYGARGVDDASGRRQALASSQPSRTARLEAVASEALEVMRRAGRRLRFAGPDGPGPSDRSVHHVEQRAASSTATSVMAPRSVGDRRRQPAGVDHRCARGRCR